ncbi:hypothetical protein [Agromyces archimandritae]|uniref:hypothetical protein n=1 Tax=Agromyces archimandritae TaxID=2781962 RepID=UPI001FD0336E|nr:hypothetical protein [Agromyces archimandritae]
MAKANEAPIVAVNVAVWVMNPGPMALVAIRKIAPMTLLRPMRLFTALSFASSWGVRVDCSGMVFPSSVVGVG